MSTTQIRWWPAFVIVAGALAGLVALWAGEPADEQQRNLTALVVVFFALGLLFLWLVLFSRLHGRLRLRIFAAGLAAVVLVPVLFRYDGVTGNFIPILKFRFAGESRLSAASRAGKVDIAASPGDFPQFLGPARNGVLEHVRLDRDWTAKPPRELWRRPVGEGWSGFAVVGNVAITQEQREGREVVAAYDLRSGEPQWTLAGEGELYTPLGGNGPRATPTVEGGQVFTLGPRGLLRAIDLATGTLQWQRDAAGENGGRMPEWGYAGSPLLVGDAVVVNVGGKDGRMLVAYRRQDGEKLWQAGEDGAGFSSPMYAELAGRPTIVSFNQGSVSGHDPGDGRQLWSAPWSRRQPNVAQPLVLGPDKVLVSTGYGIGSALFEIKKAGEGFEAVKLWESTRMKAKFTNLVLYQGSLYGLDDGVLACLDPATGERRWKGGRYGHGQILLAGDLLLVMTEEGELVLVEPNPGGLRELARVPALSGKSWNTLALASGVLLLRNSAEAAAFELAARG